MLQWFCEYVKSKVAEFLRDDKMWRVRLKAEVANRNTGYFASVIDPTLFEIWANEFAYIALITFPACSIETRQLIGE